jgi:hypothetical protein
VTASTWTAGGAGQSVVSEGPDIRHLLLELEETWEEVVVVCGWDWSCLVVIVNCIRLLLHLHEERLCDMSPLRGDQAQSVLCG